MLTVRGCGPPVGIKRRARKRDVEPRERARRMSTVRPPASDKVCVDRFIAHDGPRPHAPAIAFHRFSRSAISSARRASSCPSRIARSSGSARRWMPEARVFTFGATSARVVK